MKNFESLDKREVSEVENSILEKWQEKDILKMTIDSHENDPYFVFYDGPATANGHPGLHHMVAKFLKDSFCKYKTMTGHKVLRKVGWDTHGLPVELEVEKKLGFTNKNDIEKYGIEAFNQKCRESVWGNEESFTNLTNKMGQFIDIKNPYVTYDNNYIETEWWILKKFFDEGLFYEGSKILPFCTRCGTGLASHEVAQGYKDVDVETVIVPMKKKDEDVYFLVWTTTPWTLLANVALCVHPDYEYVEVESMGYHFILCKSLVSKVLGDDVKIIKTYKGKDLEYTEYEQLLPFLTVNKKAFYVCCDEYVTDDDGTGIVHLAPAFGADDALVGKKYNLPYLNPVGEDGCYLDGPWKGTKVFDANDLVIKYLKENDKLFKKQRITHSYPHCWRCGTPLLYYSKPSYYLEVTKIIDKIIEENKKVNWVPSYVGEKRFGNWLENMNDWAISRNRYWGTPLPLWICECGHEEMIGSREELSQKAIQDIDPKTIDLHRPYVDDITLKCAKCGKQMHRTKDVIDCWFDSGSMPFAQYHYPFENKELWETQFPADFICEGIDQTRGWFYTLLIISVFVTGKSPYKNVLVNDLLLDKDGKKMSKSKGNIVEPFTTMKEYGADTVRWYLPYVSPVWTPLKFDISGLKEVYSKFINPLKNTYSFFEMYANLDNIDIDKCQIDIKDREEIDKWLLSRYNSLLKYVTDSYEEYDLNKVVKSITSFVSDDLSNWYIRRNRNRFWGSTLDNSKKAVYMTTYEVLVGLSKMIAPVVPFISEEIYTKLTKNESVHLANFPVYDEKMVDEELENKMDLVRSIISTGRYVREENKIKVRQPLSEAIVDGKNENILSDLVNLIKEELNVKKVTFAKNLNEFMTLEVKPNFKEVGKIFGSNMGEYQNKLKDLSKENIEKLQRSEIINLEIAGTNFEISSNMVDIRYNAKDGFNVGIDNGNFIILNTKLDEKLIEEGNAREFVSRVQMLRKENDFDIADRIVITYNADDEFKKSVDNNIEYVKKETLATDIIFDDSLDKSYNLNDYSVGISLKKN